MFSFTGVILSRPDLQTRMRRARRDTAQTPQVQDSRFPDEIGSAPAQYVSPRESRDPFQTARHRRFEGPRQVINSYEEGQITPQKTQRAGHPALAGAPPLGGAYGQLQPLVEPQPSQT
jgi:hypothetical protein